MEANIDVTGLKTDNTNSTAISPGNLLKTKQKRVHYQDSIPKNEGKPIGGWMNQSPDNESPVQTNIRTIDIAPSPLENERILRSS